jgi:hypothetical protein
MITQLIVKSLDESDNVTTFPNGRVESVEIGNLVFRRATMATEWHWAEDEQSIVGADRCPKSHHIYVVAGTLGLELADGTITEVTEGQAVAIPPEHDSWTVGDENLVYIDVAFC